MIRLRINRKNDAKRLLVFSKKLIHKKVHIKEDSLTKFGMEETISYIYIWTQICIEKDTEMNAMFL